MKKGTIKKQLPSAQNEGISDRYTVSANNMIKELLSQHHEKRGNKRKRYTDCSDEQQAEIGRYAAVNKNSATLKKFRVDIPDLGESMVRLYKNKYVTVMKDQECPGIAVPVVQLIPSIKRGRPLALVELDGVVQACIRALRAAGTPINASIVLAAATGIVCSKHRSLLSVNGGHINLGPG